MVFPGTSAFYAGLLALVYVGLSLWVVVGRVTTNVMEGDGGNASLMKRVRIHANFGEYVPFALLVVALLEASGAGHGLVVGLLILLLVARLLHPVGLWLAPSIGQQACRGVGIFGTLLVLLIAGIDLLIRIT